MKIPKNINWGSAPIAARGCHFSSGDLGRASGLATIGSQPMVANSLLVNAPKDAHSQAITLIKTVYDFLPERYHQQIEFSFQIPDSQAEKINGWRFGFHTYNPLQNFEVVPEILPVPGKRNLTAHTHLTRNPERENEGQGFLNSGYIYLH